jgi:hypothetical protein
MFCLSNSVKNSTRPLQCSGLLFEMADKTGMFWFYASAEKQTKITTCSIPLKD